MYKTTKTWVDYDGNERTEDFYFNFTTAEITEMEYSVVGGLRKKVQTIIDTKDAPKIISVFKDLVLKAYGVKSDDGRRFIKNDQLREEFSQTEAYSMIFMELGTDADKASEFINGVIPESAANETEQTVNIQPVNIQPVK